MTFSKALLEVLVCPVSKSNLIFSSSTQELVSLDSSLAYPIRDGIPILLEDQARKLSSDELTAFRAA